MDVKRSVISPWESVEGTWIVLSYNNNPTIQLDARILDRVVVNDNELIMEVNATRVAMTMSSVEVARALAELLGPLTRSAPMIPKTYEFALRRLQLARSRKHDDSPVLVYGGKPARVTDKHLFIGDFVCRTEDVVRYGEAAAALPLPDGVMQAALVMLLIADRSRNENPKLLADKIANYESLSGASRA